QIPIIDDQISEGNETVLLTLSNPQNASLGGQSTATLIIQDNEPPASVTFPPPNPVNLIVGASVNLTPTITPSNAQNITFEIPPPPPQVVIATLSGTVPTLTVTGNAQG